MYLLDTNVVSELRKRERCDENVAAWYTGVSDSELFLSVLTLGEIRKGIELIRDRDSGQAGVLGDWLRYLVQNYAGRILPVNEEVSDAWGQSYYIRNVAVVDGLLAATARVHDLVLVTRNVHHVEGLGAQVLNPFLNPAAGA